MRAACLSIVLAFTSCGGEPEPTRPSPPPATDAREGSEASEEVASPSAVPSSVETPPPPGPAPTLAFVATPGPDGVALSLANHGADASLRSTVVVEVETNGTFAAAPSASTLALRYDCAHAADPCVTLAPGAELLPPSWLGTWGDMQCECERCAPVEPGRYRLVVTTCDGAHRVESNAFVLPAP